MQERAARTREGLVRAAAHEFDRNGYAGSSLARIAGSAGISTGALTFHFPHKGALATAVRTQGHTATVHTVAQVTVRQEEPLQTVVALTVALAALLERDVAVRAAARLSRELPENGPDWTSAWAPLIRERLRRTQRGSRDLAADRTALAVLAGHLIAGVEADARQRACRHLQSDGSSTAPLLRIWDLALRGLDAAPTGPRPHEA